MLPSSEEQKRQVLSKIEVLLNDSENFAYELFETVWKDRFGVDYGVCNRCLESWRITVIGLKRIKEKMFRGEAINRKNFSELHNLLKFIEVENSLYKLPIFESANATDEYFNKLMDVSFKCLPNYFPENDIFMAFFQPRIDGKDLNGFSFHFGINRFNINIYDNLVHFIPRNNPEKYAVKMFGFIFCADKNLSIEASLDLGNYELVYLDNIRIPIVLESYNIIEIVTIDNTLTIPIPNKTIENLEERILFVLDLIYPNGRAKGLEYFISKTDEFIENFILNHAESVYLINSDGEKIEIRASLGKLFRCENENSEFNTEIEYFKCMKFVIKLLPELGPLYDSLIVNLTKPGYLQLKFLQDHLKNLHSIFQVGSFYAPFTGVVQSSGFGKTKLCLDLLQTHPGIYCVFRRSSNTGVPQMTDWMVKLSAFVVAAEIDDLPLQKNLDKTQAITSTPGRFLLALSDILESYLFTFKNIIGNDTNDDDIKKAIKKIGSSFASEPGHIESEGGMNLLKFETEKMFIMTFQDVLEKITRTLTSITTLTKTSTYPFLLFLDELDVFNHGRVPGRISGLNIVRRALHCLKPSTNFFTLAIGTNSDALDFTPAVRDNSLRFINRPNILPPFILSGNWDIFSSIVNYENIKINERSLLNLAMMNILISFGRPVWSSCNISDVMDVAIAKMKNGFSNSNGARLALLMSRANLSVNVHHVLARTLLKSYMTIINYVSTDANDMKISYSSEPVLALAARSLLKDPSARLQALQAIKEFLLQKAMDKGRILETLFEHLMLFCIDDADTEGLEFIEDPAVAEFPSNVQDKLTKCQTFLLKCQMDDTNAAVVLAPTVTTQEPQNPLVTSARNRFYRVLRLKMKLAKLFSGNKDCVRSLENTVKERTLNSLIGTSHFVQLEVARSEDFGQLMDFVAKSIDRNIIDKSLLKVGVLRQCGYTMPPNYFGIDFILPISMKRNEQGNSNSGEEDIFSFVAVQSKSSKQDLAQCTFKMSGMFHLNRCPNVTHLNESQCISNDCKAYMKMSDVMAILEDQVVLLLTASSPKNRSFTTSVCLKGRKKSPKPKKEEEKKGYHLNLSALTIDPNPLNFPKKAKISPEEQDKVVEDALQSFGDEIKAFASSSGHAGIKSVDYPAYFIKNKIRSGLQPDCIITKNLNEIVTLQKMIWDISEKDVENILRNGKEDMTTETGPKRRISTTCIAVNDISWFRHLVGEHGTVLMREIIDFSVSNFQNVDPLHLPMVQNSLLNGLFSPFFAINPMLQKARGDGSDYLIIENPLENYSDVFTGSELKTSIDSCILGPIDKSVPKLDNMKYQLIEEQIDKYNISNHKMKLLQDEEEESDEEYDEKAFG